MAPTERVSRLRERMLVTPAICVERAYYMTKSYQKTENLPVILRRARALAEILDNMTVRIEEGELLAGWQTSKERGGALLIEMRSDWIAEELDTVQDREWDKYQPLSEEEKDKIREILPYWHGKTLSDYWIGAVPPWAAKLENILQTGGFCRNGHHQAHSVADYESVLRYGLRASIDEARRRLAELDPFTPEDLDRSHFYESVIIAQEAVVRHANRYAELAAAQAQAETDPVRRAELERMAEICRRVPEQPARSFREAVQSIWLVFVPLMIECWGAGMSLGRVDQYLLPYYEADLASGAITREEALELASLLLIKLNAAINLQENFLSVAFSGYPVMQGLTIGGITPDGRDAVNTLTYLFLDAEADVGLTAEDVVVRISRYNPEEFVIRACEVARDLHGKLKFVSDDTTIESLLQMGTPLEDARDYVSVGCHNPSIPYRAHDPNGNVVNCGFILELALNDGVFRKTGERLGLPTGDPRSFTSFEQVREAFMRQFRYMMRATFAFKNADMEMFGTHSACPLLSSLYPVCFDRGIDIYQGGTYPQLSHTTGLGCLANVGDSLAAIKKVVFDDKKITMQRLCDALDANYEGYEDVLHFVTKAPKFGNDDDYVDLLLRGILTDMCHFIKQFKIYKNARNSCSAITMTANIPYGAVLGATPDGRRAGEPLAEGGISPHQGRNVSGVTSTFRSVAKLDQVLLANGSILNVRVSPELVKNAAGVRSFARMLRTFFEYGGNLVQFNFTSNATLREAQRFPEKYKDLLVRVATYSAYFTELSPELQNNIIERSECES